jgi:glycosyltransferase A (GT-A) superfamily protein (DUF2064 family)
MEFQIKLSVVVPLGPGETAWPRLLNDLNLYLPNAEVVWSSTEALNIPRGKIVIGPAGRGRQLNLGAHSSTGDFIWFLHADSQISEQTTRFLIQSLKTDARALHYFGLRLGPGLVRLNSLGANFRSLFLKMPFGDQGFCLARDLFHKVGHFREDVPYGEDHIFTWNCRQKKIPLRNTGGFINSSSRRYKDSGWARVTLKNIWLTYKQALPEFISHLKHPAGLAVFVKTPEYSVVKSRLAATIGSEKASAIYEICVQAVRCAVENACRQQHLISYWAVAEKAAMSDPRWHSWGRLGQCEGTLGERLHDIYSSLLDTHGYAVVIGSDSPHLPPDLIRKASSSKCDFTVGKARDGGFYLFAGRKPVPEEIWNRIEYSTDRAGAQLIHELRRLGTVMILETLTDLDTRDDLRQIKGETNPERLSSLQLNLIQKLFIF